MKASLKLLLYATLLIGVTAWGQRHKKNPYSSAEALEEGKKLYYLNCGVCHGMDGASGRGAKLATRNRKYGTSDEEMFEIISDGIPGTAMPGLWLDEDAVWKILLFVRTLEPSDEKPCASEPGDPARGKQVFTQKGQCAGCHKVGMGGGRLGPDLSRAGSDYTRRQLRDALLNPDAQVPDRYRMVRVTTNAGKQLDGVLMNEDGYTLHMLDRRENLHSFVKTELRKIERPSGSLMPSYSESLTKEELDDVLAYLCGLEDPKGAKKP